MMRFENTVISTLCVHLILAVGYRPLTVLTVVIFIQGFTFIQEFTLTKVKSLDKTCFTRSLKSISDHVRFKGRRFKKFIL